MSQTFIEKIVQRFAVDLPDNHQVKSGDFVSIRPAYVMTHDNTGAIIPKFKSIGATSLQSPDQVVVTLDHNVQDTSDKNLEKYKNIEQFARNMGAHFYPAGRGIGHQVMCEEGFAWPGTMAVASDSHSNMYGGLGCLGTPIVRTDAAAVWATGKTWWKVPPVVKVTFKGELDPAVSGKDVIIYLCGLYNQDEVLNHVIEFTGDGVSQLNVDDRLAIANMTTEWGALAGVFPIDEQTIKWLKNKLAYFGDNGRLNEKRIKELEENSLAADSGAYYAKEITLDLSTVPASVSGPDSVKKMETLSSLAPQKIAIQKAYLVSCVNSRVGDLHQAAGIVKGKKVADGVEFYIAAASSVVQQESEAKGDWQVLLDAGAIPLPPGCGPCIGLGMGTLKDGEVGISATNRNYKGRMGSKQAKSYLASPSVVAASALAGYIDYDVNKREQNTTKDLTINKAGSKESVSVEIMDGFPARMKGKLLFCHQDNLNTDGIYPGKYTYQDDFTAAQQAEVAMENYDPNFQIMAAKGDILVGGFNFGTGSSREQAATALMHKGIQLVIAGTFSETYKRNAFNNGFLLIEIPELVNDLKKAHGSGQLTVDTKVDIEIDFQTSTASFEGRDYSFDPTGKAAQELIVAGGLESLVKKSL